MKSAVYRRGSIRCACVYFMTISKKSASLPRWTLSAWKRKERLFRITFSPRRRWSQWQSGLWPPRCSRLGLKRSETAQIWRSGLFFLCVVQGGESTYIFGIMIIYQANCVETSKAGIAGHKTKCRRNTPFRFPSIPEGLVHIRWFWTLNWI